MRNQTRLKRLWIGTIALLAVSAGAGTNKAEAWDPLDTAACAALPTFVTTPSNLNICEYIVTTLLIPPVTDILFSCSCPAFEPQCLLTECNIPIACWVPYCFPDESPFTIAAGYIIHYDEVSCDFTEVTPQELFEEAALSALELYETAAIGGINVVFYEVADSYLDFVECSYGKPLTSSLKSVMRGLRDQSPFDKGDTYYDLDLDSIRIVKESDWGGLQKDAMTLGHIVIIRDDAFAVLESWGYDLAYVQAGNLCPAERDALEFIMHEAVHVRQYRDLGKETFIDRYLNDVLVNGYKGAAYEQEAYQLAVQNGWVDGELLVFRGPSEPAGCSATGLPPRTPPGTVATGGGGGAPTVTISSMCGSMGPLDCAPNSIECDGAHAAVVNLAGVATDADGIQSLDWSEFASGGGSSALGSGTAITGSFSSRRGTDSGRHQIVLVATDNDSPSQTASVGAVLNVHDTLFPMVTPTPAPSIYECHVDTYVEAGGSAIDVCDPAVAGVSISGSVNTLITGTYPITYSATDDVGNTGSAVRTVSVVDTLMPTIVAPPEIVTQDRTPDLGTATATDVCDGAPVIHNDAPATFPYGTTIVSWWSVDASGNESLHDSQTVTVIGGDASTAGRDFSCGLSREGEVFCWGANAFGQLGDGANVDRWGPLAINMAGTAGQVSVGARHACAVKDDGTVQCWGDGNDGRLGNNATADSSLPVTVSGLANVQQVSAGGQVGFLIDDGHTCALLAGGDVRCWGRANKGQLGDGTTIDRSVPVVSQLPPGTVAVQVTTGGEHSCAIDSLGQAFCWGEGGNGRLGNGASADRTVPTSVTLAGGTVLTQIDAGERHTCAVDTLGRAWCWGAGANGRLGVNSLGDRSTPMQVTLPAPAVQVSAGALHSCALLTDGSVFCWGSPFNGRLGDGTVIFDQLVPIQAAGIANAVQVSAGFDHTCARIFDAGEYTERCWGSNANGELGDGTSVDRATSVEISTMCAATGFFPMSGGEASSCAVAVGAADPSSVMCWGSNGSSRLGDGASVARRAPNPVVGTESASVAAAGGSHGCALMPTGQVRCWGNNLFGQLGDGTLFTRTTPTLVSDLSTYSMVATGANHSCGITTTGQVKCWGANLNGRLGDGTFFNRATPTTVSGLPGNAVWIDLGAAHTCAVVQNGGNREVWCWGAGLNGRLGYGFFFDSWVPVRAGTISDAWIVSAGGAHTCASTLSGPVYCWGQSIAGQVGANSLLDTFLPVQVVDTANAPLNAPFGFISVGAAHSCIAPVGPTQQAACWGNNLNGQLGNGSFLLNGRAQLIPGMPFVSSVAAGDTHSCARLASGDLMCWGNNTSGQLGDGTTVSRDTPVHVTGACY